MRTRRWSWLTALLVALVALSSFASVVAQEATPVASPGAGTVYGIKIADMDQSADPREDFNRYANGGWLDRTTIPPDKAIYRSFEEIDDAVQQQLLGIMGELVTGEGLTEGSDEWKAAQLYQQGIDIPTRNRQGLAPIQDTLTRIESLTDLADFHAYMIEDSVKLSVGLFGYYVNPDLADSSVNAGYMAGPFLGLGDRDYYLVDDAANQTVRDAYVETSTKMLVLAGRSEADAADAAQRVLAFETALAEPTLTKEEQQDPNNSYNPKTLDELAQIYPLLDWQAFVASLGAPNVTELIVTELRFYENLAAILQATPMATIRDYLTVQALWGYSGLLGEDLDDLAFEFQRTVFGVEQQQPDDRRALDTVSSVMGDPIGKLYVAEYFPPEAKALITALVDQLLVAYRARLEQLTWMSPETKVKALEKLSKFRVKVGYPDDDKWRTYEDLEIGDSYFRTYANAFEVFWKEEFAKIGQPVDKDEWFTLPQVVNAYYNPTNNEIVFPAAILQPPFFDYQADPASNYGAIGVVIGHEITHGFDLSGSQYDGDGNLVDWWTDADRAAFEALNDEAVAQYSAIEVAPDLFVDGQFTVTENVADLGGVQVAYEALHDLLAKIGDSGPLDGFTQDERFFLALAQSWHTKVRDEELVRRIKTDPHSPGFVRATQPSRNTDAFHEVFGTQEGDAMYLAPEERVVIW